MSKLLLSADDMALSLRPLQSGASSSQFSNCSGSSSQLMHPQLSFDEKQELDLQPPQQTVSEIANSGTKRITNRPTLSAVLALFSGVLHLMRKLLLKRRRAAAPPSHSKKATVSSNRDMVMEKADDAAIITDQGIFINSNDADNAVVSTSILAHTSDPPASYEAERLKLLTREDFISWSTPAQSRASAVELRAQVIVWKIRENERDTLFGNLATEAIPGPDTLDMGGQFLTNQSRIHDQSQIYQIAMKMPKGAHLHLHFNAELAPDHLIDQARRNPNMYVRSTLPLLEEADYDKTEIVFNVLPSSTETVNIFSPTYVPDFRSPGAKPWMRWNKFRDEFRRRKRRPAEEWIKEKLVLSEKEVYGLDQTTNGIWARFNQATRCFKGLLNYESIYRWYCRAAIESMVKDGVMYAELRPMLMDKFIPSDDGERKLDHSAQMRMILEAVKDKQKDLEAKGLADKFPFGLKIIYCAPRSIPKTMMQREIADCIKLKKEFPDLICGFDLVGAEDRPNHIGFYAAELLEMVRQCEADGLSIPFMFHAGETLLDTGGSKDPQKSNLYDAVLLNAKRIGHGFSLLKHPLLVEEFKRRKICIELCPTSNELLHLCRNIKEHPYPEILAAGIPCTVNSDNPSLFSNSVSYEFYQIMVGSPSMNIHGWKQLAEWSIEYSCLSDDQKAKAYDIFEHEWEAFCEWIVATYGEHADSLNIS